MSISKGEASTSTALVSAPSPPPRSLNRQAVLDEDEYTAAISHIIARDFFPSLVHLDATNDYLDALRSDDPALLNASVRRLQELSTPIPGLRTRPLQTPSQTPWGGGPSETPLRTPYGDRPNKRPRYDVEMSLDTFQARYTSEDNSSFTEIMDNENRLRTEKWAWAWDAQKRVEAQRTKMVEAREKLLLEPASSAPGVREKLRIEAPTPAGLITEGEDTHEGDSANEISAVGKEVVVSQGDGKGDEQVDVMAPKKDTRSAAVDGWKFKTRNALMFPPDADDSPYNSLSVTISGAPKIINRSNTRLPEQDDSASSSSHGLSAPPSPTRSRVEAAIAGTPYRPRSPTNRGFSLLPSMPSPTPSELGPAAVKQLMTWGTLNATPRVLSKSDDPADQQATSDLPPPSTPFHLPAPSAREVIGHKLSSNAAKSLSAKAALMLGSSSRVRGDKARGAMAPPSWTPRRVDAAGSLTPAGKRLLDRTTTGVASSRRADAMGKAAGWQGSGKAKERDLNRVRWTPSPNPVTRKLV